MKKYSIFNIEEHNRKIFSSYAADMAMVEGLDTSKFIQVGVCYHSFFSLSLSISLCLSERERQKEKDRERGGHCCLKLATLKEITCEEKENVEYAVFFAPVGTICQGTF